MHKLNFRPRPSNGILSACHSMETPAVDQLIAGAGNSYRAGSEHALEQAIGRFIDRGPQLQRAAAVRASRVRTMDEHFAELFARYEALASGRQPIDLAGAMPRLHADSLGAVALAGAP